MNNNQQSQDKNTSSSNQDTWKLRVDKAHGGITVEEIEKPELMNDPDCKHEEWEIDPSETDFIAYVCKNDQCGMIKLFDKEK